MDRGYEIFAGEKSKEFAQAVLNQDNFSGTPPSTDGRATLVVRSKEVLENHISDRAVSNISPRIYEYYRRRKMRLPSSTWIALYEDRYIVIFQFKHTLEIVQFMAAADLDMPFREIIQALDPVL